MIRKADIVDIPLIREMAEISFRDTYKKILSKEQLEYMMDMMYSVQSLINQMTVQNNVFFIDEGNGYVSYRFQERREGINVFHLEKLYVLPSAKGKGLGKKLFFTVVDDIKSLSAQNPRIELNVNRKNPAVNFYEHLGMHKADSGDFPIGNGYYMNDFIMALNL